MSYKSILTVITAPGRASALTSACAAIARRERAHLDALCIGIDRSQMGYYYAGASAVILQETIDRAGREAKALGDAVGVAMKAEDVPWSCESAVAQLAGLGRLVGERSRFADLVVLHKPYGEGRTIEDEAVTEAALFEGRAPVLILPDSGFSAEPPRRVAVAWDESAEAMAAVRHAMPILAAADLVDIVIVDPPMHSPDRSDPGGRLSQMIARHGARCEVSVLARTVPRVSDVILRHATDRNADLIVMGAYGHSRFREAVLGGATRNMLEQADRPVFMAH